MLDLKDTGATDDAAARTVVDPGPLQGLDVERLRVSGERLFARKVTAHPGFERLAALRIATDAKDARRRRLASALRRGHAMAPGAYAAAHRARTVLGIEGEVEIYQRRGAENAAIHLVPAPILLEVQGDLLSLPPHAALVGLFGHDLGHFLCPGA